MTDKQVFVLMYSDPWEGFGSPLGVFATKEGACKLRDEQMADNEKHNEEGDEPRAYAHNYSVMPFTVKP